jgi:hypothetical protein
LGFLGVEAEQDTGWRRDVRTTAVSGEAIGAAMGASLAGLGCLLARARSVGGGVAGGGGEREEIRK